VSINSALIPSSLTSPACDRLIKILQCPENRHLLDLELSHATTLPDGDIWYRVIPPTNPNPTAEALTGNMDHYDAPEFPFLTTCLVAGTSLEPGTGYVSHASGMKWNADYDSAPNEDGITVLDITDPAAVRHCFVIFHDGTAVEDGRRVRGMMPLLGKEYASLWERSMPASGKGVCQPLGKEYASLWERSVPASTMVQRN
jgi:hypothetical protein